MIHTPTPPDVPTRVYVQFPDAPDAQGRIVAHVGCDGEDRASPEVRAMMSAVAYGIALAVRLLPDGADGRINGAAADNAARIAKALFDPEKEGDAR